MSKPNLFKVTKERPDIALAEEAGFVFKRHAAHCLLYEDPVTKQTVSFSHTPSKGSRGVINAMADVRRIVRHREKYLAETRQEQPHDLGEDEMSEGRKNGVVVSRRSSSDGWRSTFLDGAYVGLAKMHHEHEYEFKTVNPAYARAEGKYRFLSLLTDEVAKCRAVTTTPPARPVPEPKPEFPSVLPEPYGHPSAPPKAQAPVEDPKASTGQLVRPRRPLPDVVTPPKDNSPEAMALRVLVKKHQQEYDDLLESFMIGMGWDQ